MNVNIGVDCSVICYDWRINLILVFLVVLLLIYMNIML